jgi:hypothetical protein
VNKQIDDTACIAKWRELIGRFNKLVEDNPPADKIKKQLIEIRDACSKAKELTIRQVSAIYSRVENYLDGSYGQTKRAENMGHDKPVKVK